MIDNIAYLLALHSVDGLGPMRLKALLDYFKDPKLAWLASKKELLQIGLPLKTIEKLEFVRKDLDPEKYTEEIQKSGILWMTIFDENYPELLKQIYDPPIILYYKGEVLPQDEKAIAIVGTRKMTGYGKLVTSQFAKALVEAGFTIVSGLARGVDSEAHWTAVKNNGRTLAILGGGINQIYPPENIVLADQIINGRGAIISEFPPNYPSLPGNFPARNRIISGLSKAVLVTEADIDSGSLITARMAIDQGREVFTIPGAITSQMSKGPTQLIKEGAKIVSEPNDIFEELGVSSIPVQVLDEQNLSEQERQILSLLNNESKHIDEICRELNLSAASISATLLKMEITGLVRNLGGSVYCRI